jgi:opacity protein-like surface antigen
MASTTTRILAIAATATLLAPAAQAQQSRSGTWEASVQLFGTSSEKSSGENGSSLDLDSGIGLGAGVHYNFTDKLAAGFDMGWIRPDYEATYATEDDGLVTIKHEMSVFNGQFNGTWNLLEGPFTPYLQAGLGWTYVDSNVADGPPVTGCWWDPWWGYVCQNFYSTYSDTNFSWGYGVGARYEFSNTMFVKASYNRVEVTIDDGADPKFDSFKIELGWMFR